MFESQSTVLNCPHWFFTQVGFKNRSHRYLGRLCEVCCGQVIQVLAQPRHGCKLEDLTDTQKMMSSNYEVENEEVSDAEKNVHKIAHTKSQSLNSCRKVRQHLKRRELTSTRPGNRHGEVTSPMTTCESRCLVGDAKVAGTTKRRRRRSQTKLNRRLSKSRRSGWRAEAAERLTAV